MVPHSKTLFAISSFNRFFGHIRNLCGSPCRFPTAVRRLCCPSLTDDDLTVLVSIAVSFIMIGVAKFYCRLAPDANRTFLVAVLSDHVTEGWPSAADCPRLLIKFAANPHFWRSFHYTQPVDALYTCQLRTTVYSRSISAYPLPPLQATYYILCDIRTHTFTVLVQQNKFVAIWHTICI